MHLFVTEVRRELGLNSMTLNDKEFFCVRYEDECGAEDSVRKALQRKEVLRDSKSHLPRLAWLQDCRLGLCSEENWFDNILEAKTITEIPRTKKRRFDGPTGAAKKRYQHREPCSFQEQRRRKGSIVARSRREEEREAKEKEKEEQTQEKRRKREWEKSLEMAKKEAASWTLVCL